MAKLKICIVIAIIFGISLAISESIPTTKSFIPSRDAGSDAFIPRGYVQDFYAAFIAANGRIYGVEDHYIYSSDDNGRYIRQLGVLPKVNADWLERFKDHVARSKLVRSFRRNPGPSNLVVLSSGTILVFYDRIYRSADNGATFEAVFTFGGDAAAPFSYGEGIAVGPDDTVYFGEYTTAPRPHAVKIFQGLHDGTKWKVVHMFSPGEVFHVHSIQYDHYRSCYWITTGDLDSEAKVLYTDDDFKTIKLLGGGSQDWRVVSLMVTKDDLYWGSDNDVRPAGIFRWNFADAGLHKIIEIGKPSYYSTVLKDDVLVLSTTYEPESPYSKQYRPEPTTDLWMSRDGKAWVKVLSLAYERHDMEWGPTRAAIAFPGGSFKSKELLFTPLSTKEHSHTTQFIMPNFSPVQK